MESIKNNMKILKKLSFLEKEAKATLKRLPLKKVEFCVLIILIVEFLFPQVSLAQTLNQPISAVDSIMLEDRLSNIKQDVLTDVLGNSLPVAEKKEPKKVIYVTVTAYSSTVDQCDSTPCQTANGFNLCENNEENVVAANFLPFGTIVKMPEEFGDRVFTVQDRMNKRYAYRMDIWMKTREAARHFGVKTLKIEVY